jgi:uncharacterized protein
MREPYRTFHFAHPDLAEQGPGLSVNERGSLRMVSREDSVRQAIYMLLTTIPGERVMRPEYGSDLFKLVFAPNDNTTSGLAIHYVRRALELWEPRIDILRLDAGPGLLSQGADSDRRLDIVLEYRVRATQQVDNLSLSFSLVGGDV